MECETFQSLQLATGGTVDSYSNGGFAVCHFLPQRLQAIVLCENEEVSGVGGARPGQTEADTISWCLVPGHHLLGATAASHFRSTYTNIKV